MADPSAGAAADRRPAVGLVLASTFAVAVVASTVVAGLPVAAALTLGAILASTDAVAVTALARRLALPRRLVTIVQAESLLNDATSLVVYRVAVGAAAWARACRPVAARWTSWPRACRLMRIARKSCGSSSTAKTVLTAWSRKGAPGNRGDDGHRDDHSQSATGSVLGVQGGARGLGQRAGQGQAEPDPGAVVAVAEPLEGHEHGLPAVFGDAEAVVDDVQLDPVAEGAGGDQVTGLVAKKGAGQ